MSKLAKKSASWVPQENRCGICDTKLTLYPKDFMECPHCRLSVCRLCWASVWPTKSFSADKCVHLAESDGLTPVAYAQKETRLNWDWPRLTFIGVVFLIALGIIYYILNLLIF